MGREEGARARSHSQDCHPDLRGRPASNHRNDRHDVNGQFSSGGSRPGGQLDDPNRDFIIDMVSGKVWQTWVIEQIEETNTAIAHRIEVIESIQAPSSKKQ